MRNFYHVSPRSNRQSIAKSGIEPIYSTGKRKVSWFVTQDKVPWALAHCSLKHGILVSELDIYSVPESKIRHLKAHGNGLFYTPCATRYVGLSRPAQWLKGAEE